MPRDLAPREASDINFTFIQCLLVKLVPPPPGEHMAYGGELLFLNEPFALTKPAKKLVFFTKIVQGAKQSIALNDVWQHFLQYSFSAKHIAKEMLYLCEMIQEYGYQSRRTGQTQISFGKVSHHSLPASFPLLQLFDVYQFISDKVVGMLLRARKHKMVSFEGEMLFQRRDEEVVISLLLSPEEIQTAYKNL